MLSTPPPFPPRLKNPLGAGPLPRAGGERGQGGDRQDLRVPRRHPSQLQDEGVQSWQPADGRDRAHGEDGKVFFFVFFDCNFFQVCIFF